MHEPPTDESLRQIQGALALLKTGLDRGSARVEEMHLAIADKPFAVLACVPGVNVVSNGVRTLHDGITQGVHLAIRSAVGLGLDTAIRALDMAAKPADPRR